LKEEQKQLLPSGMKQVVEANAHVKIFADNYDMTKIGPPVEPLAK
jgi:hypothetical protein